MDFWFAPTCCLWASSLVPKKSNEDRRDKGSTARGQALPKASAVGWTCAFTKLWQPILYVYQGDSLRRISDILCKVITWKQSWGPLLQAPWHPPHRASYRHFRNACSLNLDPFRKAACEFNFNKLNHNFKKNIWRAHLKEYSMESILQKKYFLMCLFCSWILACQASLRLNVKALPHALPESEEAKVQAPRLRF